MKRTQMGIAALSGVAAVGLMFAAGSLAWGQPNANEIKAIVALVKKGDMAGAKKAAAAYAKKHNDVDELMTAFKPAAKKGLGVGETGLGIEQTLTKIGRDAPTAAAMAKSAKDFEEMGYNIAATGLITEALAPEKDKGKQTRKAWIEWSAGMVEAGIKLAEAAKAGGGADVKIHASKVNNNCNSCHSTFR